VGKRRVAVLGATGLVGQRLVRSLIGHPWFELVAVGGSQRRAGTPFGEALHPLAGGDLHEASVPSSLADLRVQPCAPGHAYDCDLVFSALPAEVANEVEPAFARAGYAVVSNARSHRMEVDVPLVIPEVNHDHIGLVETQRRNRDWRGCIVTNPNCSTIAMTLALAPLATRFGLEAVQVTTMQALSGAGLSGPGALDMLDNVVPYIGGEEEKMETEPKKLLGTLGPEGIKPLDIKISAQCNRVATLHGHLECVAVKLASPASREDVLAAWQDWHPLEEAGLRLPTAPARPVIYLDEPNRPQPRVDRDLENGMASITGRLRPDPILDYKFVTLGHNLARGAAGGTLLLAELLHASGLLD
jgi:aspartate-semialdehyde dehydrogenase